VMFAEGPPLLSEEALSLQGGAAHRTLEALRMEVLIERLHPAVTGLDWKSAADAFGGEELIPVVLAVW